MTLPELEAQVRDLINHRRKQHELLKRGADWNKLCSALDVVGDTELALDAYLSHKGVEDIGLRYLFVYGALQILQTQQEAVAHICEALGIKPQHSPKIPGIREIRSSAVGHPTQQREAGTSKSSFIQRISLSHHGFTLMTVYSSDRPYTLRYISIPGLANQQRQALRAVLEEVVQKLTEAEMTHRTKHKSERLRDAFPPTLGYYIQKIFEAAREPTYFPLGKPHVDLVTECLDRFKAMLKARGEWGIHDSINYECELLQYPLEELGSFFTDRANSTLNEKDAYIFTSFVQNQMKQLQVMASELDEEYSETPSRKVGVNPPLVRTGRKRGALSKQR